MSEHADSNFDFRCGICGRALGGLRCHHCHPIQAQDRDATLAEWSLLPPHQRLLLVEDWLRGGTELLALWIGAEGHVSEREIGAFARRMASFVRLAGDGDLALGVDRLKTLHTARELVA